MEYLIAITPTLKSISAQSLFELNESNKLYILLKLTKINQI